MVLAGSDETTGRDPSAPVIGYGYLVHVYLVHVYLVHVYLVHVYLVHVYLVHVDYAVRSRMNPSMAA
ncbi:hypothetical protein ACIQNG_24745 [Streptomyces sp. NPDC091377]|uniref:hypothetical protein n=1 Tax=Streptomyces sp. NPDC091377 TaxID=3365995 RepID=UPI00380D1326